MYTLIHFRLQLKWQLKQIKILHNNIFIVLVCEKQLKSQFKNKHYSNHIKQAIVEGADPNRTPTPSEFWIL